MLLFNNVASVPFGNSKIISSHAVIYSYCVQRPGQVIRRWKWAGTGGEFKFVTHFVLPHMKVITQSLCPQLTTQPSLEHCIAKHVGLKVVLSADAVWTLDRIDQHIFLPKDSWTLEEAELRNVHIKKRNGNISAQVKLHSSMFAAHFSQSSSHCRHFSEAILLRKC